MRLASRRILGAHRAVYIDTAQGMPFIDSESALFEAWWELSIEIIYDGIYDAGILARKTISRHTQLFEFLFGADIGDMLRWYFAAVPKSYFPSITSFLFQQRAWFSLSPEVYLRQHMMRDIIYRHTHNFIRLSPGRNFSTSHKIRWFSWRLMTLFSFHEHHSLVDFPLIH